MISVAIATYNGSKYITEQLESILQQDLKVDEIVIVDDHSTDTTLEILKDFSNRIPFIKISSNPLNMGTNYSFQKAIEQCSGDFIFICDQDDIWLPNKTIEMTTAYNKNPKGLTCSDAFVFSNDEEISDSEINFHGHVKPYFNPAALAITSCFPGHNMMLTRELALASLPFPKFALYDHWLTVFASIQGEIVFTTKKLTRHRIHANNQAHGKKNKTKLPTKLKRLKSRNALEDVFSLIYKSTSISSLEHELSSAFLFRNIFSRAFNWRVFYLAIRYREVFFPGTKALKAFRKAKNLSR